ncbi:MAG: flavodoxin domain-containing protein [Actinobacteria bacterium]|nr:flavodoxin domain-containing protein [Actinomycetota bacterium]
MEKNTLVAYASKRGATAEIAIKIGEVLRQKGLRVDVLPVDKVRNLTSYRTIVLGSAVYIGQWRRDAVKFLTENEKQLSELSVWLFSSGPTGAGDPLELMKGWRFPESLRSVIERIKPRGITCFGGKLDLKTINFLEKFMINKVQAPIGDFRNWEAITSWAEALC